MTGMCIQKRYVIRLAVLLLGGIADAHAFAQSAVVSTPPDDFFKLVREADREAARAFYKKHLDVGGVPVVAAELVADQALVRTHEIVTHLLAGRPDVIASLVENGMYLIIIGKDQVYTDMPEYRNHPNPAYQNERVRGTGGKPTSFGEENLLSLPLDRYDDESIAVHEFCHTIDGALRRLDPSWSARRNATFENARRKGLYNKAYAGSNAGEYWAEICQAYFDCNRVNNWNHGPVGTREQLKVYDPEGYELVRTTFRLTPEQDWRYSFAQTQPSVSPPPPKLKIDPYYTKFTWAREFTVVGRGARDESLLKANDTIRKLFAYRHDILKALMAEGVQLVVLAPSEKIADLPEYKALSNKAAIDALARSWEYSPELKLLVAAEENVLADPQAPNVGDNQVIRAFASAIFQVLGSRPADPVWDKRPRNVWQQYELGLKRLDAQLGQHIKQHQEQALAAGKWKGTAACHDALAYWTTGVLAYFDAAGQQPAPLGASEPVVTRESLRAYDEQLYDLVHETFAYAGRPQWRLK
jgi:alpha-glucosidase